ncbi:unnamed protein product, partial [Timema podura]|nr:unnamed protein product [Timema podura]
SGPKPVFHTVNGKRSSSQRTQQEPISPQHAELINFIYESWEQVCKEYEQEPIEGNSEDFKPFDLESWWGKRLFHNITKSI